jgi:hypothetical protein
MLRDDVKNIRVIFIKKLQALSKTKFAAVIVLEKIWKQEKSHAMLVFVV